MLINESTELAIPDVSVIPGVKFRPFRGASDYASIVALISGAKDEDGLERADSIEKVTHNYTHLTNCDPYQDVAFAEVDGKAVGYNRFWWEQEENGAWVGNMFGMVLPTWRRRGIGTALLRFGEDRARQTAIQLTSEGRLDSQTPRCFSSVAYAGEKARSALLEKHGYSAVRREHIMVRPDLENIPEARLPEGIEVRPVQMEHLRKIFDADVEAFRDHWGYVQPGEAEYENWVNDPDLDPSVWRVAWDGNEVVGSVKGFIDSAENAEYGRLRGYTEGISVLRAWRRRGIARALLTLSLQAMKDRGMHEAALSVDAQNLNQAFQLYESVGFRQINCFSFYRKPF